MSQELLKKAVESTMKETLPEFDVGDTVNVSVRIIEGDKERIQVFTGTVIGRSGSGISETSASAALSAARASSGSSRSTARGSPMSRSFEAERPAAPNSTTFATASARPRAFARPSARPKPPRPPTGRKAHVAVPAADHRGAEGTEVGTGRGHRPARGALGPPRAAKTGDEDSRHQLPLPRR